MTHCFITPDGQMKARWREVLPGAVVTTPEQGIDHIQARDVVWLVTLLTTWRSLIEPLVVRQAEVVVLSYTPNDKEALEALDLGARGYAHTLSAPEVLKQISLVVSNQGVWVGEALLSRVLGGSFKALQQRQASEPVVRCLAALTERERSVAMAVTRGATNKEIARQLGITERTVKAHLGAVFKKLAVRDRLQLILKLATETERHVERP